MCRLRQGVVPNKSSLNKSKITRLESLKAFLSWMVKRFMVTGLRSAPSAQFFFNWKIPDVLNYKTKCWFSRRKIIRDFRQFLFTCILPFILWRLLIFLQNSIVCKANKVILSDDKKMLILSRGVARNLQWGRSCSGSHGWRRTKQKVYI